MALLSSVLRHPRSAVSAAIAAAVIAWNLFIALNDDGFVRGRVEDAAKSPAADVEIVLHAAGLVASAPLQRVRSGPDGSFLFAAHGQHHLRLQVQGPDGRLGESRTVRLLFRDQNVRLDRPLRIDAATDLPAKGGGTHADR